MTLPHSLPPIRFPFPALAQRAGRSAIGDGREAALACLMAARLASALLPPLELAAPARAQRATSARAWLASLALPAVLRVPLVRAADASAKEARDSSEAIRALAAAAAATLDGASRRELERLADALAAGAGD